MGDRCYLTINVHRDDVTALTAFLNGGEGDSPDDYDIDDDDEDGMVEVIEEEANYGLHEQREEAAKAGVAFYGTHSSGSEYGPYAFAAAGGELAEAETNWDGFPAVRVIEGEVNEPDLQNVQAYLAILEEAKKAVHRGS